MVTLSNISAEAVAEVALARGFPGLATPMLTGILRTDANRPRAMVLLAWAAAQAGFAERAGMLADQAIALEPGSPDIRSLARRALGGTRANTESETIATGPDSTLAGHLHLLCRMLRNQGELTGALRLCREAVDRDPMNVDILRTCSDLHRRAGLSPTDDMAGARLANARSIRKTLETSPVAELHAAAAKIVSHSPDSILHAQEIARAWLRRGRLHEARELIGWALKARPSITSTRLWAAQIEVEACEHEAVLGHYEALDQDDLDPDQHMQIARSADLVGDHNRGRRARQAVLAACAKRPDDPRNPYRRFAVAELEHHAGRAAHNQAIKLAVTSSRVDLGPSSSNPDQCIHLLEGLCQASGPYLRAIDHKDSLQHLLRASGATDLQPESFTLPSEYGLASARLAQPPAARWILKPAHLFGGNGIRLLAPGDTLPPDVASSEAAVLQRYIDDPFLIDGLKPHLRIYTLFLPGDVSGFYRSRQGIVRLAIRPFSVGTSTPMAAHVTNTNFHAGNPDLIIAPADEEDIGHVRGLAALSSRVSASRGVNLDSTLDRFAQRLAKTLRPALVSPYVTLLALDILVDQSARPWLMEIESRPMITPNAVPIVEQIHTDLAHGIDPILRNYLSGNAPDDSNPAWRWITTPAP